MTLRLAPPSHALINQSPPPSFISPRPPLRREGRAGQCWLAGLLICSPAIPSYIIRAELRFFLFSFFNLVPLSRIHRHLRPSWTNKGDIMHENHLDIHRCPSPNLRLFGNHSFDRPLFFSFSSFQSPYCHITNCPAPEVYFKAHTPYQVGLPWVHKDPCNPPFAETAYACSGD